MRPPMRPCGCGILRSLASPVGRPSVRAPTPFRAVSLARPTLVRLYSETKAPPSSTPSSSAPSTPSSTAPSPQRPQHKQEKQQKQQDSTAFKTVVDIKHIRSNPDLHRQNCIDRNYPALQDYPDRIVDLYALWQARLRNNRAVREQANAVRRQLANAPAAREIEAAEAEESELPELATAASAQPTRHVLLREAKALKSQLAAIEADEAAIVSEMEQLAAALPNLASEHTPRGNDEQLLSYINCDGRPARPGLGPETPDAGQSTAMDPSDPFRSHVHIGSELGILDFSAAGAASGWGWYYLLGDGARLEQALVQYALTTAHRHGWSLVSPPSVVRSHIGAACGFQPRDQGGEQQVYALEGLPLSLTATAEIPLAALHAGTTFEEAGAASPSGSPSSPLPLRHAAVSRCYRAEAGARGANTKGLYRVHEFTKVEMFAWTLPDLEAATEIFDELVDIQTEILSELGLRCRVLEMPTGDLGASAYRKIDIEAFFPGRATTADNGWGEVTSTSICTDYQTRRLSTKAKVAGGKLTFPYTLNGTALAVPRVLAAILENGWDEDSMSVTIPECLQPWMGGQQTIAAKHRHR